MPMRFPISSVRMIPSSEVNLWSLRRQPQPGRALADAGFGLQFADCEKETDPEVADAPFEPRFLQGEGAGMGYAAENVPEIMDEAGTVTDENNLPGQHQIEEYLDAPQTAGRTAPVMQQNVAAQGMPPAGETIRRAGEQKSVANALVQKPTAAASAMMQGRTPAQASHTPQQNVGAIDKKLPWNRSMPCWTEILLQRLWSM